MFFKLSKESNAPSQQNNGTGVREGRGREGALKNSPTKAHAWAWFPFRIVVIGLILLSHRNCHICLHPVPSWQFCSSTFL